MTEKEYSIFIDDIMANNTHSEILEKYQEPFSVSFKVIGTGAGATDIIEKVKSFGYDCVGCMLAKTPGDCIPMDDDKMVIIVANDNEDVANAIAKTYHDAGVLTIGLVKNADFSCYDNIAADTNVADFPEVIKHLLQPIVTRSIICYDFNDLCTTLRNFRFFRTLVSKGGSVEEAVHNMQQRMENIDVQNIGSLSAHLFFNRERKSSVTVTDMKHLSEMISCLPESIDVIWSVNFDDTLPDDLIVFTIIMSENEL